MIVFVSVLMLSAVLAAPASASLGFGQESVRGSGSIDSPENAVYPIFLPEFDGSFYEIFEAPAISWPDAAALVDGMVLKDCDTHLAAITSPEEQAFLFATYGIGLQGKWYGGFQPPDELNKDANWGWVTGEPWVYTNWSGGEPNDAYGPGTEQYILGWDGGTTWNDEGNLNNVTGYLVEHEGCDLGPTGRASFMFNVRNNSFVDRTSGSLLYRLPAAGLTFRATGFDDLFFIDSFAVVEGRGTFNGAPGYSFFMVVQEDLVEMLYIEISDTGTGEVVYTTFNLMPLRSGYIAIHPL